MQSAIAKPIRSVLLGIVALAGVLGQAGQALSQTPDTFIFGPTQYVRGVGPDERTEHFSIPAGIGAPFLLRVQNGNPDGSQRTTSGEIDLDNVTYVREQDFGNKVSLIERTIKSLLPNNNELDIKIKGQPGSRYTVSVLGTRIQPVPTKLAPNPLTVSAGASGNLTATLAPAPPAAGTLSVSSSNTGFATVPSSVAFAAGQTQVTIPVTGVAAGNATVSASLNGTTASATVQVTPAPPTITSFTPSSLAVTQGAGGTLTVTISAAQTADTAISLASSNPNVASVAASATVPAGQVSAPVQVSAIAPGTAQITAGLNGSSASSEITVNAAPPTVVSLVPVMTTVALGASTTLTLTISAAQAADTLVPLAAAPAGIVTVPAQVTVPAGQTSASVPVASLALGQAGITASLNGSSASSVVNVVPPPVQVVSLVPVTFTMNVGATSQFTVTINSAQLTNTDIALAVDNPGVLQVPATVTVAQGQTSAVFTATGLAVGNAIITASANNTQKTASVHVAPQPAAIVSLLPNPLPLQQGATGTLTVTINVAQEADTVVALADDAPAIAQVGASVTVPAGSVSAAIPVNALLPGSANLTASVNGTSAATVVTVTPPPPAVASVAPAALTTPKGTPGTLRVTVTNAPNAPIAVALVSSNPAAASVPATVNIPAGALFADFPVASNSVGQATITASLNGGSAASIVTITPAELVTLTLSPQASTAYVGDTVQFTATGTMTDGSSQDFTTSVIWASSSDAIVVASINAAGVASALAAGTANINVSFSFVASATGQSVTVSSATTLTVKQPVALVLTAPTTTLLAGASTTVTITSSDPAPPGGLVVTLTATGAGTASFPQAVTIPEFGTSTTFTVTGGTGGSVTITATAPERLPGSIAFTIQQLAITSFAPTSGPVGIAVAISGIGFDPVTSNNQVSFNGVPAVLASGTATLLNAIVPPRATTGAITVTNTLGTATSATPFTVQDREAFDLTLSPAAVQVPLGGNGAAQVALVSTGLNTYPYAAAVTVSGLPPGISFTLDRPSVFLGGNVIATFTAQGSVAAGTYPVTISATGQSGVTSMTRSQVVQLQVLPAGSTTVSGRVLHADDGSPFVGVRIRLGTAQVFTDATGTYRFVSPPLLGDQVMLIDGNFANSATAVYPSGIAMPVFIVAGQDNQALTSYIQAVDPTSFTNIVPGAAASVTNPNIPNFSLNIPQGAVLVGWDGTPVTQVSVRTVSVDRLPIKPIPDGLNTRSVYLYYFFREGGANPTTPIPVTMANDVDALPGEKVQMWYYDESVTPDPNSNQWRVMGTGTVTPDGKSVVSDPGVGIPKFCCGASLLNRTSGGDNIGADGGDGHDDNGGGQGDSGSDGAGNSGDNGSDGDAGDDSGCPNASSPDTQPVTPNPVDLASGNAHVFKPRPFGLSKLMPVNLNCRYRSTNPGLGLFGHGTSFSYDWFAEVVGADAVRVTNPAGVRYMLSRESDGVFRSHSGRKRAIEMEVTTTPTGRTLKLANKMQYEFDLRGRLLAVDDPNGNRTTLQLDGIGFPVSLTDATGAVYRFDRVVVVEIPIISRITDPQGRSISFAYGGNGLLTSYTDQGGGVTSLQYDANNRVSQKTDPRGAVETFQYDSFGRTTQETLPDGSVEQFSYNAVASSVMETRHTDANGNTATYRWNSLGYLVQLTDALGQITKYDRDPIANLVRKKTDSAGKVWQYTYNSRGDLIQTVDPQNNATLIDYDLRFRKPIRIQNALGNVVTMNYDDNANLLNFTNAELQTTAFTYTAKGQLASVTDPLNHTTSFVYDPTGNLIEKTDALGETSTRVYDLANRLIQAIDPLNRVTNFTYDNLDRVTQVQDAASGLTRYAFDANSNLTSVIDPNGNPVERNVYDLRNRLTQKTDAKNLSTTYTYDGVGNMTSRTDRKGQVTQYGYDALNRVSQVQDADGRTTTYGYDLSGNLTRISDTQSGDILMSYDSLNRLIEVVTAQGTVDYAYDAIGRRTSRTVTGGDITTYAYDKANRVTGITMRGKVGAYAYDAAGRLASKTLPDGIQVVYTYDDANRLTSMAYAKADGTPIEAVSYAYDPSGQRIQKAVGGSSVQETPIQASFDEANRMTSVVINNETFNLTYDPNGNLTSKIGPVSGTTTYTWDARNRLAQISGPSGSASFQYDALGRRTSKTVNGATTGFLYDGTQAIAELQGSAINATYHNGLEIDEVLARYGSAGNKTLLTDALRSVIAQADDAQVTQNFYAYSPHGEVQTLGPDDGNPLQYTGRENDGTGLYFYRARYYDPVLKRFIAEDPIGIAGGKNLHRYAGGNPVSLTDPSGNYGSYVIAAGVGVLIWVYVETKDLADTAVKKADATNQCNNTTNGCNQAQDLDKQQYNQAANVVDAGHAASETADLGPDAGTLFDRTFSKIKRFCKGLFK